MFNLTIEFGEQLVDIYKNEPRFMHFTFNQSRRGLHISLNYEDDQKTKYNLRRMKSIIETYKTKYCKVAICLTSMLTYSPSQKDDTALWPSRPKQRKLWPSCSSLDLKAVGYEAHLTLLRRDKVHKKTLKKNWTLESIRNNILSLWFIYMIIDHLNLLLSAHL